MAAAPPSGESGSRPETWGCLRTRGGQNFRQVSLITETYLSLLSARLHVCIKMSWKITQNYAKIQLQTVVLMFLTSFLSLPAFLCVISWVSSLCLLLWVKEIAEQTSWHWKRTKLFEASANTNSISCIVSHRGSPAFHLSGRTFFFRSCSSSEGKIIPLFRTRPKPLFIAPQRLRSGLEGVLALAVAQKENPFIYPSIPSILRLSFCMSSKTYWWCRITFSWTKKILSDCTVHEELKKNKNKLIIPQC